MYRTYIINAPMIFTGLWRAVRIFLHPVTAAKISVSSWGYEKTFHRDGIVLFGSNLQESMVPWRKMAQRLASAETPRSSRGARRRRRRRPEEENDGTPCCTHKYGERGRPGKPRGSTRVCAHTCGRCRQASIIWAPGKR